jgi:regulator of cell morphogenesis and NO signaling
MPKDFDRSTVGEIVARDRRTAAVFARHGIDFCCGGHARLADACAAHNVDTAQLISELERVDAGGGRAPDVTSWTPDALIDLIVNEHHAYVRREVPAIMGMLEKLWSKHGSKQVELSAIARVFDTLADELYAHMQKEERVLFPYIASMAAQNAGDDGPGRPPFSTVRNPIRVMEHDHAEAAAHLEQIQQLTNGFTPPADACATWKACYATLDAFDRDLREHVHLENNVLFPAAVRLENTLSFLAQAMTEI